MRANEARAARHEVGAHIVVSRCKPLARRKAGTWQPRNYFQRVAVIDLSEDVVWEADPVELPERVIVAVVVKVLVVGFEYAPVVRVFVGLEAVFAKQDPILILDKEIVRRPRLASEVVKDRADFRIQIR